MKGQPIMESKEQIKYYWLKLERHFFKRHDIRIIEAYPNGILMSMFYLKLLVESIDHNGSLRFSDKLPYNPQMLSAVTGIGIEVVVQALELLTNLNLIETLDDGTIRMLETEKMLGLGSSTERVRNWRERNKEAKQDDIDETPSNVTETVEVVAPEEPKKPKALKNPIMKDDVMFTQFWNAYPRKIGKDKCQKWFKVRKITQDFVDDLVLAINQQIKSEGWKDVQYIPHPYTWLNRGGWNDELKYSQPIGQKISKRWENFLNGNE